jgi:hypothetical protein
LLTIKVNFFPLFPISPFLDNHRRVSIGRG